MSGFELGRCALFVWNCDGVFVLGCGYEKSWSVLVPEIMGVSILCVYGDYD